MHWHLANDWPSPVRLTDRRDGVGVRRRIDEAPPSTARPVNRMVLPTIAFIARRSGVLAGSPISSVFTISIRPADLPHRPPLGARTDGLLVVLAPTPSAGDRRTRRFSDEPPHANTTLPMHLARSSSATAGAVSRRPREPELTNLQRGRQVIIGLAIGVIEAADGSIESPNFSHSPYSIHQLS